MTLEYADVPKPGFGQTSTITEGLEWLRMPLPFDLNHINLWLLRDGAGWVIVDTGAGDERTLEIWPEVFAGPMRGDAATHVVATHMHPDHIGCAGFLARHFDVDFWITRDEYMLCRILVADTGRPAPEEGVRFYQAAGFDDEHITHYKKAFGMYGRFVTPMPEAFKRLKNDDSIALGDAEWRVITGGGHSPEHASLYDADRNILISGDQLLPTISSIVGVWPTEPRANPLAEWFKGLRNLKAQVPEDVLVLPAHGRPFCGAHERIDALIAEHEERLDRLKSCCAEPKRVVDTFADLFKSEINDGNRIMATGEALSHMHYLIAKGEMSFDNREGITWYQST